MQQEQHQGGAGNRLRLVPRLTHKKLDPKGAFSLGRSNHDKLAKWAAGAGIRAVKTAAQSAIGTIGASAAMGEVDWALVGSADTYPAHWKEV